MITERFKSPIYSGSSVTLQTNTPPQLFLVKRKVKSRRAASHDPPSRVSHGPPSDGRSKRLASPCAVSACAGRYHGKSTLISRNTRKTSTDDPCATVWP